MPRLPAFLDRIPPGPLLGWRIHEKTGKPYLISYSGDKGLLTCVPNRGGKDVSAVIVNGIVHRSSLVDFDPKGETTPILARWRAEVLGQDVHPFDPLLTVPDADLPSPRMTGAPLRSGFNPIEMIRTSRHPVADAKMVANALIPIEGNNPFFPQSAQSFFAAAACFVALDPHYPHPRTMRSLWRDLTQQSDGDFIEYLKIMETSRAGDGFAAGEAIEWLGWQGGNAETLKSVRKTMKTSAGRILDDPHILDCLSYTSVDFGDLQRRPTSVFVVLPGWASEIYAGFMRLLLGCMFAQIERAGLPPAGSRSGKTLFLFNEFATLRRSEAVREAMPRMPGYGVQFWLFVQDLNQLRTLYESGWETFFSNPGVIQFYGGSGDNFTAGYLSVATGVKTIPITSINEQNRADGGGMTHSSTGRPLLFPHEITALRCLVPAFDGAG